METTLKEVKELLIHLKEETKEIKQNIEKLKIELTLIHAGKKKNKKLEKYKTLKSEIIKMPNIDLAQKPQPGSFNEWFMINKYPKIIKDTENLVKELENEEEKIKDKGKEKIEISEEKESSE